MLNRLIGINYWIDLLFNFRVFTDDILWDADWTFVLFNHLQILEVICIPLEKFVPQTIMIVLIVDGGPANHFLLHSVRLIAQWLVSSHPANNNLLFLRSQIVECDSVRSQASNETHDVQVDIYFVRPLLHKLVELCKLLILLSAAAIAQ